MARSSSAEPTEAPSARRLVEARRRGFVGVSRDLSEGLGFVAFVSVVGLGGGPALARLGALFRAAFSTPLGDPGASMAGLASRALDVVATLTLVPLSAVLVVSALATTLQTGGSFVWRTAVPAPERLSPAAFLARFARGETLSAAARGAAKLALLAAVVTPSAASLLRGLSALAGAGPRPVLATIGALSKGLGVSAAATLVAWGALDWVLARRRHQRALMTTRAEAMRERKDAEGDPLHKAARRRRHRETVERRLVEDVRRADFVVRGGGEGDQRRAVAVGYDRAGLRAPTVLARGARLLAGSIIELARAGGIPVHLDDGLTQALTGVAEGEEIPEASYQAVAELLRASGRAG